MPSEPQQLSLYIDVDRTGSLYDSMMERVREVGAQDMGDAAIFTKANGTKEGNPIAMLAFTAVIQGKPVLVQTVTTVRLLKATLKLLEAHYPNA